MHMYSGVLIPGLIHVHVMRMDTEVHMEFSNLHRLCRALARSRMSSRRQWPDCGELALHGGNADGRRRICCDLSRGRDRILGPADGIESVVDRA